MAKAKRGRPRGAASKVTNEAKRAILMAFDKLGGVDRLVAWVEKAAANEALFWTRIFPKLLPRPAVEAPPAPPPEPVVRGALIWEPPTPSPYPRLSEGTSAAALAGVGAGAAAERREAGQLYGSDFRSG